MGKSLQIVLAAVLWGSALAIFALVLLSGTDPELPLEIAARARAAGALAALVLAAVFFLGALLWPPFLPALRLLWHRTRRRLTLDPGPMMEGVAQLRNFETARAHTQIAGYAFDAGDLRRAIPHAARALELEQDDHRARFLLGQCLLRVGAVDQAVEQLQQLVDREPTHAFGRARGLLGQALLRARQPERAVAVLREHARDQGTRQAWLLLADALGAIGEPGEARLALQEGARPPGDDERLPPEDALARARARVRLWKKGGGS